MTVTPLQMASGTVGVCVTVHSPSDAQRHSKGGGGGVTVTPPSGPSGTVGGGYGHSTSRAQYYSMVVYVTITPLQGPSITVW